MKLRALLSVYNKEGLVDLARGLVELGFELVTSGGTARILSAEGLPVTQVEQVTGAPELLGGRVKTLHPAIHAGILARPTREHLEELEQHHLQPFDLVVCNLYPFAATVNRPGATEMELVEDIDIGGVSLLRAAAKNFERVAVICDPADYTNLLMQWPGGVDQQQRKLWALKAFRHTATYDMTIADWMTRHVEGGQFPSHMNIHLERSQTLRYGENPHQSAAFYGRGDTPSFRQLSGKELSYNNLVDLDAAWMMPREFEGPAVAIVKHTNPSGLAEARTLAEAFILARECDPVSAFGSVIAVNRIVDEAFVEAVGSLFVEVLAAPGYSAGAAALLAEKKKNCRVLLMSPDILPSYTIRSALDGYLMQTPDPVDTSQPTWRVVSSRPPTETEMKWLDFGWKAVKHVKSNAITLSRETCTLGIGAGQMNRVDSVRLAVRRAGERAAGSVLASDAFFPFADGIREAGAAGVTAIVQPGGSVRDAEVISAADEMGMVMVFTGVRHFRH